MTTQKTPPGGEQHKNLNGIGYDPSDGVGGLSLAQTEDMPATYAERTPAQRAAAFLAWAASHDPDTPVPTPDAFDRNKIYAGRG